MTPDQVTGFFDAGESFVEGTIAAALVALWIVVLAVQMARPYMLRHLRKFTLRLGADLWWILYVGLRELLVVLLFLGGFIFFYPDVVSGQDLPVTGGLATACVFGVMLLKLVAKGESDTLNVRWQTLLLGVGATLYILPYMIGVQVTMIGADWSNWLASIFVSSQNTDLSLPLCYLSAAIVGVLGIAAVVYNLRQTTVRRPHATEA
jgi:hypothetical protein